MSLKVLAEQVLDREHVREQNVNKGQKSCSRGVNTPFLTPCSSSQEMPAVTWLQRELSDGPKLIAALIRKWVGDRQAQAGRLIDELNAARQTLGIMAYAHGDSFWWQLPELVE